MIFRYDTSWEGLLSAVFDAFSRREFPEQIIGMAGMVPTPLFAQEVHRVATHPERAARVWCGVEKRCGRRVCNMLLHVWLSEDEGADALIFRYLRKIFEGASADNFGDEDMLAVHKLALKVAREGEHVRQFLRLQKAKDGSYFAPIAPKYNALPLAVDYLKERFSEQRWLVYDTRRRYGYLYDNQQVREVAMEDDSHLLEGKLSDEVLAADEKIFQEAWRDYLDALTIRQRLNPRLQRQHMPTRFWKYLTEKQK